MRSLWFRLVGAFALIIVVMLVLVVFAVRAITFRQFDLFVARSGAEWAERAAPALAAYYIETGSWVGVEDRLATLLLLDPQARRGQMPEGKGPSENGDMQPRGGPPSLSIHLVLADASGTVIYDPDDTYVGDTLSADFLSRGTSITVDGEVVGTLLAVDPRAEEAENTLRRAFQVTVVRSVIAAGLVAGALGLIVGTLMVQRITAPLDHLRRAAQQVAGGDLTARVPIETHDEVAEVGHAFNDMAQRLDEQQILRKQMVADIAHELRTPISVIQGTLEAMLDGVLPPEPGEIQSLHDESRRLARLVADLRTLSLADAGQLTLELGTVDPVDVAQRTVNGMSSLAESRQIELSLRIPEDIPSVNADSDRLVQMLTNLIDNALRYTPEGGQVQVRVRHQDRAVLFEIQDSGPGIPPENLSQVFERFWRGDKSRNRNSGGSGIGLSIVKQLAEMHGGAVSVASEVGQGSVFSIELPSRPTPA